MCDPPGRYQPVGIAASLASPPITFDETGFRMFDRTRTATKFFFYGLAIGLLFAPGSGSETRARVFSWANQTVRDTVSGLMGGQSNA